MKMVQDIIIKPVITEASMDRLGMKRYTFKVANDATKPEIAKDRPHHIGEGGHFDYLL